MADVTMAVLDALGTSKNLTYSDNSGSLTPYHLAKQSGTWTVAVSGTTAVSGTVVVTGVATVAKQDAIVSAINEGTVELSKLVSGVVTNTDGVNTTVIPAQGAGVVTYLTDITLTNSSATEVVVEIKDDTTTKWLFLVPAGGGVTHSFTSPLVGSANKAWRVDAAGATTTIYASFSGFKV